MTDFILHTLETAPGASKHRLARSQWQLGFIPNLFAVQAEAPALLEGYQTLSAIFARSSLTPTEREVVLLTASYENDCSYCIAHHSAIAKRHNVPKKLVLALREGQPLPDLKLEALRDLHARRRSGPWSGGQTQDPRCPSRRSRTATDLGGDPRRGAYGNEQLHQPFRANAARRPAQRLRLGPGEAGAPSFRLSGPERSQAGGTRTGPVVKRRL